MGVVIKIRQSYPKEDFMRDHEHNTYWAHIKWFGGGVQIKFERYLKVVSY